jgi:serine/threonine-protein kinase
VSIDEHGSTLAAGPGGERSVVGARYEILGLLGAGGMGNVYRARDRELDEVVALKLLRPEIVAAAGALERFRREVKLARRVTHPNVARVFDIGEHGGDRILTMELVDGESLSTLARREPLPLSRVVEITRAICAGVGAAHAAGVVHRDLKPDNVLVAKDGRVVVTDFGIARAAAEGSRTLGFVGTPAYMAPEQIDERATIDHRVDVYALGAVIYELLIGEPAWQAESLWALAAARLLQPPPDPREKRPELPAPLCDLVVACMARTPSDRPQTMADVDARLASISLPASARASAPKSVAPPAIIPTTGTDKRVAVLPFTSAPDQDYVADGLTEDLIDSLSVARGLRVRSRGAVMQYKGAARDARDVGRELDVNVVVEGSVRRSPNGFRVSARLVSVADGFQLWARKFDVTEGDLLVQNEVIARAIAEALTVDLAQPPRAPASGEAVDLYLQARHAYRAMFAGDRVRALELYDRLLVLTPDDPRALAGRAMAGGLQWSWTPEERRRAYELSDRALVIAPDLADAHAARGALLCADGEPALAMASMRRALEIDPASAEAHQAIGRALVEADAPESIAHLEAAIALEPTFEFPYVQLWRAYELAGRLDRADEVLERARPHVPRMIVPVEGRRAMWRRDTEAAKAIFARLDPSNAAHARARRWIETTATGKLSPATPFHGERGAPSLPMILLRFGMTIEVDVHAYVGDLAGAIAALQRVDAVGGDDHGWLEHSPILAELRARPEVAPIRERFRERAQRVIDAYRATD